MIQQLETVLTASQNANPARILPAVGSAQALGLKKGPLVTTYERIARQITQENRQDAAAAGVPVATTVDTTGRINYTFDSQEWGVTGDSLQFFMILTLFRHILVCAGLAAEHSFHSFHMWFLHRLQAGIDLKVVERCCKALLGKIDRGDATWTTVLNLFGVDQMDLLQKRSVSTQALPLALPAAPPKPTNQRAKDVTAGGVALTAICHMYNKHSTADPGHSTCLSPTTCNKQHICIARLTNGNLCGGAHPFWEHMNHQKPRGASGGGQ